jgi:hypothetical protein
LLYYAKIDNEHDAKDKLIIVVCDYSLLTVS